MNETKKVRREWVFRIIELSLILSIAFANSLIYSIRTLFNPEIRSLFDNLHSNFDLLSTVVLQITAIGVLFYILSIRKRSFASIGLRPNSKVYWLDNLLVCIILTIAINVINKLAYACFQALHYLLTNRQFVFDPPPVTSFARGSLLLWLVFMIINPFFEELIVRGYLMSELNYLTKHKTISIVASIILQTSYHLYQGLASALYLSITFIIYSLYFAKYRKIMPIILSHLYFDLTALFYYRFQ